MNCVVLHRIWYGNISPEHIEALSVALSELETNQFLQGRAQLWALLITAWNQYLRGEATKPAAVAKQAIQLAKSLEDVYGEHQALDLLCATLSSIGNVSEAQKVVAQSMALLKKLIKLDPENPDLQYDLGLTHSHFGDIHSKKVIHTKPRYRIYGF